MNLRNVHYISPHSESLRSLAHSIFPYFCILKLLRCISERHKLTTYRQYRSALHVLSLAYTVCLKIKIGRPKKLGDFTETS